MKKIIVPVDFSDTAAAALRFGTYLAEVMNMDLEVVHVFDANFSFAQAVSTGALRAEQERLTKQLEAFTRKHAYPVLATFQGNLDILPAVKTTVVEGYPGPTVQLLSAQDDVALMVMGGVGAGDEVNPKTLFGGVAQKVTNGGGCPVILLPRGYGYPKIERLALAFAEAEDIKDMSAITRPLIKALHPEVYFLHVRHPDLEVELENEETFLTLATAPGFPSYTYRYETLPSGQVTNQLLDYAKDKAIGLLVVGGKRRGFWNQLFHKSHLKPLVRKTAVPLLVVPFTD